VILSFVGMELGGFVVKHAYRTDVETAFILECLSCKTEKQVILEGKDIKRVRCLKCGRMDVIIPVKVLETGSVLEVSTINEYQYRKILKEYKNKSDIEEKVRELIGL